MSMPLVNYSSSDSDSDSKEEPANKRIQNVNLLARTRTLRFLLPNPIKKVKINNENGLKNQNSSLENHDGRIRSFEHERGNWATHVYIPVHLSIIEELQESIQKIFKNKCILKKQNCLHISLSKTVVLRHHWIDTFVKSIRNSLSATDEFIIGLRNIKIYGNEEKTRTFIALTVDPLCLTKIITIVTKMDFIMKEFLLDTFHQNPSFHSSILWCVGDYSDILNEHLFMLQNAVEKHFNKNPNEFQLYVKTITCKTGNKIFDFPLL